MRVTRREFLMLGATVALSGCGSSKSKSKEKEEPKEEEKPKQIVEETTYYDVIRCDYREGVTGDIEVRTLDTYDFSNDYAMLEPDGAFSFSVNGVDYTTKLTLGDATKHLYSGIEDAEVTQLLFDGSKYATVGTVDIEGFYVDNYILLEMSTSVNGTFVDATYYLGEHIEE